MGSSVKPKAHNPRFMQALLPDYLSSVGNEGITEAFKEKLEEEKDEEIKKMVLVTENDENSQLGECECHQWVVKVEGGCYFRDGWKEFCEHHNLRIGEFLVFEHLGNLVFHDSVYDLATYSCQSLFHPLKFNGILCSSCDVTITPYLMKRSDVNLPIAFVRSNDLYRKSCPIKLIDVKGRPWQVKLMYRESSGQPYIAHGWKAFLIEHNLKPRNVIRFEIIEDGGKIPTMKCYRLTS